MSNKRKKHQPKKADSPPATHNPPHSKSRDARIELKQSDLTIAALIRAAFPRGTRIRRVPVPVNSDPDLLDIEVWSGEEPSAGWPLDNSCWETVPPLPPDVFAIAGLLLELSGAAHHVITSVPSNWLRPLRISPQDVEDARAAADVWRETGLEDGEFSAPDFVQKHWDVLWDERNRSKHVFEVLQPTAGVPPWWHSVVLLLMCADEAAKGFGFQVVGKEKQPLESFFENFIALEVDTKLELEGDENGAGRQERGVGRYTIATVPADLVCVLPKSRTSQIGCTLRSLSHHLALLPARGKARAYWHAPPRHHFPLLKDSEPLNLLLIPHPFDVPPSSFIPEKDVQDATSPGRWDWFGIKQAWGPKNGDAENGAAIVEYVRKLVEAACREAGPVHGIVFPELALTRDTFERLRNEIKKTVLRTDPLSHVDIIVAGLRADQGKETGNRAAGCLISRPLKRDAASEEIRYTISNTQQKHHRWRLDPRQINAYGLGSNLTNGVSWWESLPLLSRSLNVFVIRAGSILVPLICEDLARLEPVHELVRSIGPNLVIALLMDGPQVAARWPGRYAMGLADDPGSSVLTLTSLGLVKRASERAPENQKSRSVGLWRDQTGHTKELVLREGASAILLSLSGQRFTERTIDGRTDSAAARVWVYADQTCITIPNAPDWAT